MVLSGRNEPGREHKSVRQDINRKVVVEIKEHRQEECDRDRAAQMPEKDVGVDFFLKPQAQFAILGVHGWIPFLALPSRSSRHHGAASRFGPVPG